MIRAGDSIHNPVTGERIVFRQTSADTGGEAVVIETFVEPHGFVAAAHVHPVAGGALPGPPRHRRLQDRRQGAGRRPRHPRHRPGRHAAQVLERRR